MSSNNPLGKSTLCPAALLAAGLLLLGGCESLREAVDTIRTPKARLVQTELETLSFTEALLRFDVEVENPNPIGITLAGFDYELQVEERTFVSGEVTRKVAVPARGKSIVPVPVELVFGQLIRSLGELAEREQASYRLSAGFTFDLPVLGRVRIPVSARGAVPIVRLPRLSVQALRLDSLSLSAARLSLELELENPNRFTVFIDSLAFRLRINGRDWASGMRQEPVRVPEAGRAKLVVPIELDFAAVGRSVVQLITVDQALRYELRAEVDAGSSLKVLKKARLPFDLSGELRIVR